MGLLSILLESGQLELLLSTGLVGNANRRLKETIGHNIGKLIGDSTRKVESEPEQVQQIMITALTSTLN